MAALPHTRKGLRRMMPCCGRRWRATCSAPTAPEPAQLAAMAEYVRGQAAALSRQDTGALLAGDIAFGEPPVSAAPLVRADGAVRR